MEEFYQEFFFLFLLSHWNLYHVNIVSVDDSGFVIDIDDFGNTLPGISHFFLHIVFNVNWISYKVDTLNLETGSISTQNFVINHPWFVQYFYYLVSCLVKYFPPPPQANIMHWLEQLTRYIRGQGPLSLQRLCLVASPLAEGESLYRRYLMDTFETLQDSCRFKRTFLRTLTGEENYSSFKEFSSFYLKVYNKLPDKIEKTIYRLPLPLFGAISAKAHSVMFLNMLLFENIFSPLVPGFKKIHRGLFLAKMEGLHFWAVNVNIKEGIFFIFPMLKKPMFDALVFPRKLYKLPYCFVLVDLSNTVQQFQRHCADLVKPTFEKKSPPLSQVFSLKEIALEQLFFTFVFAKFVHMSKLSMKGLIEPEVIWSNSLVTKWEANMQKQLSLSTFPPPPSGTLSSPLPSVMMQWARMKAINKEDFVPFVQVFLYYQCANYYHLSEKTIAFNKKVKWIAHRGDRYEE